MVISSNSPNLSSPSSPLSSFKPSLPNPSSSSLDSHHPTKLLLVSSFFPTDAERKRRLVLIHVNPKKPKEDSKEEEPKSTPLVATQIKGSDDVVNERGGMYQKKGSSDVGVKEEEEEEEKGKRTKDGSSFKKPPKTTDTEPKVVGFKNPLFSHELKSLRLKAKAAAASKQQETENKTKFSIALSKEDIEADFLAITQSKKMPKKRKRPNNKEIERLFPGSTLMSEITSDTYRVRGFPGSRT